MWPNPRFPADLVTFTEKYLMENFIFCEVDFLWIMMHFTAMVNHLIP